MVFYTISAIRNRLAADSQLFEDKRRIKEINAMTKTALWTFANPQVSPGRTMGEVLLQHIQGSQIQWIKDKFINASQEAVLKQLLEHRTQLLERSLRQDNEAAKMFCKSRRECSVIAIAFLAAAFLAHRSDKYQKYGTAMTSGFLFSGPIGYRLISGAEESCAKQCFEGIRKYLSHVKRCSLSGVIQYPEEYRRTIAKPLQKIDNLSEIITNFEPAYAVTRLHHQEQGKPLGWSC